jgi:redox-sensitive bicupin YhaK (pirin superfamily)
VTIAADRDSLLLPGHDVPIGRYTTVRRLLPQRQRRMVGAWCFVDHFGPVDVANEPGMQIAPHPHTGLQTVTWLVDGEILHRDSLGSAQTIVPGQLNLMTAGHGIAHSEQSPPEHPPVMHGLQLWVALPDSARHTAPSFEHHAAMPVLSDTGMSVTVVLGELAGARSPALAYSPIVGAEITLGPAAAARLPLDTEFEYGVLSLTGRAEVAGVALEPWSLLYLGSGKSNLDIRATSSDPGPHPPPRGARLFLLGGEPFDEPLVMWWNFVGRSHDEIVEARADWEARRRFGPVAGCEADRLPAPAMPTTRLKARDRHGVASVTN